MSRAPQHAALPERGPTRRLPRWGLGGLADAAKETPDLLEVGQQSQPGVADIEDASPPPAPPARVPRYRRKDAATAAVQFLDDIRPGLISAVTVRPGSAVFSLAGAALLWAGVAVGTERLREAPLVVKPKTPRVVQLEPVPVDPSAL